MSTSIPAGRVRRLFWLYVGDAVLGLGLAAVGIVVAFAALGSMGGALSGLMGLVLAAVPGLCGGTAAGAASGLARGHWPAVARGSRIGALLARLALGGAALCFFRGLYVAIGKGDMGLFLAMTGIAVVLALVAGLAQLTAVLSVTPEVLDHLRVPPHERPRPAQ